jgi:toxin ParE1/3/4
MQRCMSLAEFPGYGTPREDIRPGARMIPFRRRVTIAYSVRGTQIRILGIFDGGRDFEALLRD